MWGLLFFYFTDEAFEILKEVMELSSDQGHTERKWWQKHMYMRDFPGGPVVKNPTCNAEDMGSIPGQGTKISHAAGQISPHAATRESVCCNERSYRTQRGSCSFN